jgi:hypothetical protein
VSDDDGKGSTLGGLFKDLGEVFGSSKDIVGGLRALAENGRRNAAAKRQRAADAAAIEAKGETIDVEGTVSE